MRIYLVAFVFGFDCFVGNVDVELGDSIIVSFRSWKFPHPLLTALYSSLTYVESSFEEQYMYLRYFIELE